MIYPASDPAIEGKIWRLDVDTEQSVYTWLSSSLLLVAAFLLFLISSEQARRKNPFVLHWMLLSVVFVFLSLDESVSLHEWASAYIGRAIGAGGLFFFAWVIPAIILCLVGAILYLPFILSFPLRQRILLVLSALIFLSGAIGMEMVAGAHVEKEGLLTLSYRLFVTIEEGLEGLGVILFLYTLMMYRESDKGPVISN